MTPPPKKHKKKNTKKTLKNNIIIKKNPETVGKGVNFCINPPKVSTFIPQNRD